MQSNVLQADSCHQQGEPFSAWVFDLDGTISDPLEGMLESFNYALVSIGCEPVAASQMQSHIGPPLELTMAEFAGTEDTATITLLIERYRSHYKQTGFALNTLYPGIVEFLQELASRELLMGVCTAKTAPVATSILQNFRLEKYFQFVSGGDVGISKASQLEKLLADGTIDHNALMLGDRKFDLEAAHANQLRSCAVAWGYGSADELQNENPHLIVQRPADLFTLLTDDSTS